MSKFATHLADASTHATRLRWSLEAAQETAPSPELKQGTDHAVVLASRLQGWAKSSAHSAKRRDRKR